MSLKYNTVTVRFIHMIKPNDDRHYLLNHQYLYSNPYQFYLPDKFKKHSDIGSVIINDNPAYQAQVKHDGKVPFTAAVITDNYTERNSAKNHAAVVDIYQPGHLRTYFHDTFGLSRKNKWTEKFYQQFRQYSHPYWVREFAKQKGQD